MEHIRTTKVEQVKLLDRFSASHKSLTGTLYLTATHLLFIDSSQRETWILHHHIAAVEKLPLTTSGCPLVIQCKNFRIVHFVVPRERDCHDIYNSLLQLSRTAKYEELYAFSYNPKQNESEQVKGWQLIDLAEEYKRMGVPNANWQLSDANRDYKICETYPRELYVPRTASKPIIVGSSKFRSKGRFPVLSYYHKNKEAAICRCSQPLSGFSARCLEDEHMLQAISKANPSNRYMYVMDTRPKLNAMANRAAGKGYENEDNYSNIRFQFVGIENIHVMRSSLQKLLEGKQLEKKTLCGVLILRLEYSGRSQASAPDKQYIYKCLPSRIMQLLPVMEKPYTCMEACFDEDILAILVKKSYSMHPAPKFCVYLPDFLQNLMILFASRSGTKGLSVNDFLSGLENSGWLRHIKAVLDAAVFLVKAIAVESASVLVHCSDGWDRTSQVCSLGALLLDSYYRTIKGFMVLIEKDWISFGHKFSDRCCQLDGDPKEISPVFTQFLESVWNLTEQFPQAFEYNEAFLLQIHEHVHSCQFGNFLGNCQKEREELKLKEKTYSLWPFLLGERKKYQNPLYNPDFSPELTLLEPNTVSFNFKFWRNMYHQFDRSMHPRQSVSNLIMNMSEQNKQLEEDIKELEAKIKRRNGQSGAVLVKEHQQSAHPAPVALKTPPCFKEQPLIPVNDAVRTIEGSNTADNRYSELVAEFSKAEPAVVSLEYGVARMTC